MSEFKFNPELVLSKGEQASLVAITATEGFKVLQRIARSEVDKFILDLINTDSSNADVVLERHRVSKTAAQLLESFARRVSNEVGNYLMDKSREDKPVDVTEGILDFGPHSSRDASEIRPFEEEVTI